MPRPSIGGTPMTSAECQARYRAARTAGAPIIPIRRRADRRGRIQRWNERPVIAPIDLQAEYASWLEVLPNNQQDGAIAWRAIVDLDLSELPAAERPRGFGGG